MDRKEIQNLTREYFKKLGFQVIKNVKFYYDCDDYVLQVWMQHSCYGALYYYNYYFRIKSLHPEVDSIVTDVWDNDGARFSARSPHNGFAVEYPLWTKERYLEELSYAVGKTILPIIREGIPYIKKLAKKDKTLDAWVVFLDENKRKRILSLPVQTYKIPNFFRRLKLKKYQPIVDYVEGELSVVDFQDMFNQNHSLRKTLNQPMDKKWTFLKDYDYNLFNMLTQDWSFANRNWNTITIREMLQEVLTAFLDNFGIKYILYKKYLEDHHLLLDIQPSWLDVVDDTLDSIVYEIPKDLSKTKQIAWGKQCVKELFRYDKTYPRWIQGAEWPIVNGKPLVFSHQERIKGDDYHVLYYFYDPDTNEQTVVEQFS